MPLKDIDTSQILMAGVSTGTASMGFAKISGWLHEEIGFIAMCVGILASMSIFIAQYYTIKKIKIETKKIQDEQFKNYGGE